MLFHGLFWYQHDQSGFYHMIFMFTIPLCTNLKSLTANKSTIITTIRFTSVANTTVHVKIVLGMRIFEAPNAISCSLPMKIIFAFGHISRIRTEEWKIVFSWPKANSHLSMFLFDIWILFAIRTVFYALFDISCEFCYNFEQREKYYFKSTNLDYVLFVILLLYRCRQQIIIK